MKIVRQNSCLAALILCTVISGCASNRHSNYSKLGDAKRHVIEAQVLNKNAALNPDPNPVDTADGIYLDNVLGIYRGLISDPATGVKRAPPRVDPRLSTDN